MKAQISLAERASFDARVRAGVVPMDKAADIIATEAQSVRLDAWQLQFPPLDYPILKAIGIYRPIDIGFKYLHVFATLLDGDRQPLLALHTMPEDPQSPGCPSTMAGKGSKIRIFAMTPDASQARLDREQNRCLQVTESRPLRYAEARAQLVKDFASAVEAINYDYTVPVSTVRYEIEGALNDPTALEGRSTLGQRSVLLRRRIGRRFMGCTDAMLAQRLNRFCAFNLGDHGMNSNSGAGDIAQLLGYGTHSYTAATAPFIQSSMLDDMPVLQAELARIDTLPTPYRSMRDKFRTYWNREPQPLAA